MPEVTVIGGGVGGMVCALLPAREGHRVRPYERLPRLGGKLVEQNFPTGSSHVTTTGGREPGTVR
ncbi:NAD(P)-binding protein [Streptosporangium sp. NPDC002607]